MIFGQVHPFGLRSTIAGHAGRPSSVPAAAAALMSAISSSTASRTAANVAWDSCGVSPSKPTVTTWG